PCAGAARTPTCAVANRFSTESPSRDRTGPRVTDRGCTCRCTPWFTGSGGQGSVVDQLLEVGTRFDQAPLEQPAVCLVELLRRIGLRVREAEAPRRDVGFLQVAQLLGYLCGEVVQVGGDVGVDIGDGAPHGTVDRGVYFGIDLLVGDFGA